MNLTGNKFGKLACHQLPLSLWWLTKQFFGMNFIHFLYWAIFNVFTAFGHERKMLKLLLPIEIFKNLFQAENAMNNFQKGKKGIGINYTAILNPPFKMSFHRMTASTVERFKTVCAWIAAVSETIEPSAYNFQFSLSSLKTSQ